MAELLTLSESFFFFFFSNHRLSGGSGIDQCSKAASEPQNLPVDQSAALECKIKTQFEHNLNTSHITESRLLHLTFKKPHFHLCEVLVASIVGK